MNKATARKRLEEERERLQGIADDLQRERDESVSDTGGELSSFDQHPGDSGTETFEMEKNVSLQEQVDDELQEAMPATRFCVEDQAKAERQAGYPGSRQ